MKDNGLKPNLVKAGKSNLFLSELFCKIFVEVAGLELDLYENESSLGAAVDAAIGVGVFENEAQIYAYQKMAEKYSPPLERSYEEVY